MEEKISVIVPVYNVEKYLRRCVDSIIAQTYTNLEIILVDDGSPDNCPGICDEYAARDDRIKVIHKKNGGLSEARNYGMRVASGSYIGFVDSDDFIHPRMYERLYTVIKSENSDIVSCDVQKFYENQDCTLQKDSGNVVRNLNSSEAFYELIQDKLLRQTVWNKLYKASLIANIPFDVGKINEDEYWSFKPLKDISKLTVIDDKLYFYLQRKGSIMGSYSLRRLDLLEAKLNRWNFAKEYFPELEFYAKSNFYLSCIYSGQMSMRYLDKKDQKIAFEKICAYAGMCSFNKSEEKKFDKKTKVWYLISRISIPLVCRIKNFFGKGF